MLVADPEPVVKSILLAEDDARDAELMLAALQEHQLAHLVVLVRDGEQALDYLWRRGDFADRPPGNPSLVLLELKMPKVDGLEVLKIIRADAGLKVIPVVVLSESRDKHDLIECYRHGVNAYVVKPVDFKDLGKAVAQLGLFWTALNVPPPSLQHSRESGEDSSGGGRGDLSILHLEGNLDDGARVVEALEAAEIPCRVERVETRQSFLAALEAGGVQLVLSGFACPLLSGPEALALVRNRWPDLPFILFSDMADEEAVVHALSHGATDYVAKGCLGRLAPAVRRAVLEVESRVARSNLEVKLIEAQKMDVVGRLAGGVAHDFNNILAVVMGFSELLDLELAPDSPLRRYTEEMRIASELGAGLTRQLLVFSRNQSIFPVVLDLNEVIQNLDQLLRRLIEENVEMTFAPGEDIGQIKADPGYLSQIVMNLAVNARDAMPGGGRLTITTGHGPHPAGIPGEFVTLVVADTGCGLSEEVRQRLFDPFFTTKPEGKGTGLGLSTCQTILRQCQGYITVSSQPGQGTSFSMYFPRVNDPTIRPQPALQIDPLLGGTETLLVVEDESALRSLARDALTKGGYQVLCAANGREALQVVKDWKGPPIQLVVTDVVMPQMGGRIMAERLQVTDPQLKFLFTSGYSDVAITQDRLLQPGTAFLPKPYTPAGLTRLVRELLDAPPG